MNDNNRSLNGALWPTAIALMVLTFTVYAQSYGFGFLTYDDPKYVTSNSQVQAGLTLEGLRWALTTTHDANWFPVTWLSHMLTTQLFGLNAGAHHLVNVFIHIANTCLLLHLLVRMTRNLWPSALVAGLFALHPLHVESVVWIAERKDVLSSLFWFLTMIAYCRYVEQPGTGRYLTLFLLFAVGLMTKPMLVTLPLVLLLLDYWPLNRFQSPAVTAGPVKKKDKSAAPAQPAVPVIPILREKAPLLALSAISCIITINVQQKGGALNPTGHNSLLFNAGNAFISYVRYLGKTVWPKGLAVFYPLEPLGEWRVAGALLLVAGITVLAVVLGRRFPWLAVGWLWYLGTMVPVIGFIRVGSQSMADRYTYMPLIGVFIMLAWGIAELAARRPGIKTACMGGSCVLILVMAGTCWAQLRLWRNDAALFKHALAVTDRNWVAAEHLASVSMEEKIALPEGLVKFGENTQVLVIPSSRTDEALSYARLSLEYYPYNEFAYSIIGQIYFRRSDYAQSIEAFEKARELNPALTEVYFDLAKAYTRIGRKDKALEQYTLLQKIDPAQAEKLKGELDTTGNFK